MVSSGYRVICSSGVRCHVDLIGVSASNDVGSLTCSGHCVPVAAANHFVIPSRDTVIIASTNHRIGESTV